MKFKAAFIIISFLAFTFLFGCKIAEVSGTKVSEQEEYMLFESAEPAFTMRFFGDYWFHDQQEKFSLQYNPVLFKSLKKPLAGSKPKLLFIAHTTIPLYISAIGLIYNKKEGAERLAEAAKAVLKTDLDLKNTEFAATQYVATKLYRGAYVVKNRTVRIEENQIDHFINIGDKTVRLIFWSHDSYETGFVSEIEKIVRTIEVKE